MTRQALVQIVEAFGRSETRTYYSPAQIRKTTSLVLSPFTLGQRPRSYVLLRGPQDVGKRVIALSVVHALCCEEEEENQWGMTVPPEEACGRCAACELLRKGQCPDLIEVEPSTCSPEVLQELAGQNPSTAADELPNRFVLIERIERLSVPAFHTLCELLWYPELTTRRTLFLLTVTAGSDVPWHPGILANHHQERGPRPQSLTCESDFPVDVWPDSVYPTGPNGRYSPAEIADAEGLLDEGVPLGWRYLPEQCGEPLKVLLRRYPFFLDAREAMSWIATREGRLEDAAYHLTQYIALSQAPSQLAQLGQVLLKLERFDEAIVALEYALFLQQRPTELGVNQVSPAKADVVRQATLDLAVAKSGTNSVRPLDPRLERGAEDVGPSEPGGTTNQADHRVALYAEDMSDRGTSGTHTPIALFATWETALEDVKRRLRDWLVPIAPNQSSETELVRQWSMFGVDYWLKDPLNPERQLSAREVLVELVRESDASIR